MEAVGDVGTYLVWRAGATRSETCAWLVEDGVATAMFEDGWDAFAIPEFDFETLDRTIHSEIGVIRVETLHAGVSNSRAGIDLIVAGWLGLLDTLTDTLDDMEPAPTLAHAAAHPLTGVPVLRLNLSNSGTEGAQSLRHAKVAVREAQDAFFRTCMACGEPRQEMMLRQGRGVTTRTLYLDHWREASHG